MNPCSESEAQSVQALWSGTRPSTVQPMLSSPASLLTPSFLTLCSRHTNIPDVPQFTLPCSCTPLVHPSIWHCSFFFLPWCLGRNSCLISAQESLPSGNDGPILLGSPRYIYVHLHHQWVDLFKWLLPMMDLEHLCILGPEYTMFRVTKCLLNKMNILYN